MGSGVSHTNTQRLRSMLVVKAYNARDENETLAEQFLKVAMTAEDGSLIISINEIVEALNLHPMRTRQMFRRCGDTFLTGYLNFGAFIKFLENGILDDDCKYDQKKSPPGNNHEEYRHPSSQPTAQGSPSRYILKSKERRRRARHFETMYPQVPIALGIKFATQRSNPRDDFAAQSGGGGTAFKYARSRKPTKEEQRLIVRSSSEKGKFNPQSFAKKEPLERREAPGLWRKREIVIQERRTEYTKIDADGVRQDLVESEKSHTEILHMETEGGEFAHREKTQYEQFEKFNNDFVQQQEGNEEFVHLKSKEDEYSHFESSMPENNENATEETPPMPDPPHSIVLHSGKVHVQPASSPQCGSSVEGSPPPFRNGPPSPPLSFANGEESFSPQ